tara:strand:- start:60 stop:371 length:312 start_codon:yes stop_codon:yes gene_type:complete
MVLLTHVRLAAAVIGKYLLGYKELTSSYGVLVVTDTVHVHVTDVITGSVLVVDSITQKLLELLRVVSILFVQVVYTVVVHENVQDVTDVHPTLTDITSVISVP